MDELTQMFSKMTTKDEINIDELCDSMITSVRVNSPEEEWDNLIHTLENLETASGEELVEYMNFVSCLIRKYKVSFIDNIPYCGVEYKYGNEIQSFTEKFLDMWRIYEIHKDKSNYYDIVTLRNIALTILRYIKQELDIIFDDYGNGYGYEYE